jgi:hypothetical protein
VTLAAASSGVHREAALPIVVDDYIVYDRVCVCVCVCVCGMWYVVCVVCVLVGDGLFAGL